MVPTSNELTYRTAGPADLATCVRLMEALIDEIGPSEGGLRLKRALPRDFQDALASDIVVVFLAEQNGHTIGLSRGDILHDDPTFRLREDPRCGYVDQMFVDPAARDRGVGQVLLSMVEQWFRQHGIVHVLLHAAPKAARLYARFGYMPNREMYKQI